VRIERASDYDLFGVLESVEAKPAAAFGSAVQTPSALLPILQ
jgi:hypothetical protein